MDGGISGPLLDRIDIHIDVHAVKFRELTGEPPPDAEDSASIRQRVIKARERQCQRFAVEGIFSNAAMTPRLIRRYCRIDTESYGIGACAYFRRMIESYVNPLLSLLHDYRKDKGASDLTVD